MTTLLVIKQLMMTLYSKYEVYLTPLFKFLLALVTLTVINARLGYMDSIDRLPVVLIVALMCSFMPKNFVVVVSSLFILLHLYAFSLECAIIIGAGFLLLFLLYLRFSPKDTLVVVLTPIAFLMKIPYIIPLAMGLIGTPTSALSVGCGVIVYFMLHYVTQNVSVIDAMSEEEATAKIKMLIDGLLGNKEMIVMIMAFSVTIILVYIIRRLSVDHAWTIAMISGVIADIMVLLAGDLMFEINISIVGVILGNVVAFAVAVVLQFLFFNVDYSRTEKVQFEDDEYYYYVKAVPKVLVSKPEKRVKQISTQKARSAVRK